MWDWEEQEGGLYASWRSGVASPLAGLLPGSRAAADRDPTFFGPPTFSELPSHFMMTAMRSPTTPRSEVSSPRQKFDSEMLKGYMKKLFPATLQSSVWPPSKDRDQVKLWIKEIGERVKERMLGTWCRSFLAFALTNLSCL